MSLLYLYKKVELLTLLAADEPYRQWHDNCCVLFVAEGKGELDVGDRRTMLTAGSVLFGNAGRLLEIKSFPQHDLIIYMLSFHVLQPESPPGEPLAYRECRDVWLPDGEQRLSAAASYRIDILMKQLRRIGHKRDELQELECARLLHELLGVLQEAKDSPGPVTAPGASGHGQSVQTVIRHMLRHYREPLTRDDMARLSGFHPHSFSKLFKQETGQSFSEYLAGIRIAKAKEQLLLSGNGLDEIAESVGYSNGLYLSRKFKQFTGTSPKAYVAKPKRIVIYDWTGNVLALGERPVGASYYFGLPQLLLLRDELQGVVDVGRHSIDAVIELSPELIVAPRWLGSAMIGQLQQIAPTLIVPYGDPFERLHQLAQTLNRGREAEQFAKMYRERAAEVKQIAERIIRPGETVGLYEVAHDSIWVFNEFHGRGGYNLYRGMGLTPPPLVRQHVIGKGMIRELKLEELPAYAGDHMVISYPFEPSASEHVRRWMAHEAWQNIPAFRHNRIYFIDRRLFHPIDVLCLYKQLELQRRLFASLERDDSRPFTFVHETGDIRV